MFNRNKREKYKKKLLYAYDKGFSKAERIKNEEIRVLKIKHDKIIKGLEKRLLKSQEQVQNIQETYDTHYQKIIETNCLVKEIKNDSYVQSLQAMAEHKRINCFNDETEKLLRKSEKAKLELDEKIIKFERSANE